MSTIVAATSIRIPSAQSAAAKTPPRRASAAIARNSCRSIAARNAYTVFTANARKNRTYPLGVILETVSTFNLGYSMTEVQAILRKRFHRNVPERTITSWVTEYRPFTTYSRLRRTGQKLVRPENIIRSHTFHHQQVYRFQVHQAKLGVLTHTPAFATPARGRLDENELSGLTAYLESIETHFPHHLFQATQHRSSKFLANLHPPISRKENHATRIAALALPTAPNSKPYARSNT
jgi:hypothetical protein